MTSSIVIRGGFEAAHRLPQLGEACASVHGHSWRLTVTVTAPVLSPDGTVAEFGAFKRAVRAWTDAHWDNGAMLGIADPLLHAFTADGSKTFRFGAGQDASEAEQFAHDQAWPTVEAVAIVIAGGRQPARGDPTCARCRGDQRAGGRDAGELRSLDVRR
jgi:6-pyruvoyltetrahydropterin/6-carboxytetrahydropterin synthase